jgi:hypothetical protein
MGAMNKINRSNYEEYVISYFDGSLDPVETAELLLFLEQFPELKEEVSSIAPLLLNPGQDIHYDFKDLLIQPSDVDAVNLTVNNYNHYFAAAHEGDLSARGMKMVEAFINIHPELKNEYELFAKARLKADPAIRFPNPAGLIKPVFAGIRRLIYLSAAAASILILMTLYLRIDSPKTDSIVDKIGGMEIPEQNPAEKKTPPSNNSSAMETPVKAPVKATVPEKTPQPKPGNTDTDGKAPTSSDRNTNQINPIPSRQILNNTPEPFNSSNRNFYSDLFGEITKMQEPMLASLEIEPEPSNTPGNLPVNSRTGKRMGNLLRNGAQIASQVNESFSGWMLADLGIEGINALTDNDLRLERIVNPDGSTEKVRITENGSGYAIARKPN